MKNNAKKLLKIILKIGIALYPFFIFFALNYGISFRLIALALISILLMNFLTGSGRLLLVGGLALAGLLFVFENVLFLKLYPVMMNLLMGTLFADSLYKTPLIEVFAKRMGYRLDEKGKAYARKATVAWVCFFVLNIILSTLTVFLPINYWVLYNGLISYLLIGLMMLGEWCVRQRSQK